MGLQERSGISGGLLWVYLSTLRWSVLSHPAVYRRSEEEAEGREKKDADEMPRSHFSLANHFSIKKNKKHTIEILFPV